MASSKNQNTSNETVVQSASIPSVAQAPVAASSTDAVKEQSTTVVVVDKQSTAPVTVTTSDAPASTVIILSPVQIEEQAALEADKCIARLIKVGTIVSQDSNYLIDVKLAAGQFSINGHPLSADMLQF